MEYADQQLWKEIGGLFEQGWTIPEVVELRFLPSFNLLYPPPAPSQPWPNRSFDRPKGKGKGGKFFTKSKGDTPPARASVRQQWIATFEGKTIARCGASFTFLGGYSYNLFGHLFRFYIFTGKAMLSKGAQVLVVDVLAEEGVDLYCNRSYELCFACLFLARFGLELQGHPAIFTRASGYGREVHWNFASGWSSRLKCVGPIPCG